MENLKYEMFSIMYADLKIGKTIKLRRIKLNKKFPDITKKKKKKEDKNLGNRNRACNRHYRKSQRSKVKG